MHRFRDLLYVEGHDAGSWRGFEYALELARLNGARLTAVGVAAGGGALSAGAAQVRAARRAKWGRRLEELSAAAAERGMEVGTRVLDGDLAEAVVEEVDRAGHDLVIKVVDPGTGWRLLRPAPADRRLVRSSPASVWLVDAAQRVGLGAGGRGGIVLAPVSLAPDEGELMDRAVVAIASSLAEISGADLRVVHVWSLLGEALLARFSWGGSWSRLHGRLGMERRERTARLRELAASATGSAEPAIALRKGDVAREVLAEAWRVQADVVVVGSDGRRSELLRGELAERIALRAPASVLVVKPGAVRSDGGTGAASRREVHDSQGAAPR